MEGETRVEMNRWVQRLQLLSLGGGFHGQTYSFLSGQRENMNNELVRAVFPLSQEVFLNNLMKWL